MAKKLPWQTKTKLGMLSVSVVARKKIVSILALNFLCRGVCFNNKKVVFSDKINKMCRARAFNGFPPIATRRSTQFIKRTWLFDCDIKRMLFVRAQDGSRRWLEPSAATCCWENKQRRKASWALLHIFSSVYTRVPLNCNEHCRLEWLCCSLNGFRQIELEAGEMKMEISSHPERSKRIFGERLLAFRAITSQYPSTWGNNVHGWQGFYL